MKPVITVLLPVYNASKYIKEALDSVLSQTFSGFEVVAIDDCSQDNSISILNGYSDARLRVYHNPINRGVATVLNQGLDLADGEYIARMDADDICKPSRLETQLKFLRHNADVDIVGTWVRYFSKTHNYISRYPVGQDCVRASILFSNPLAHPTVMFRKDAFVKNGLRYDENYGAAQDYELWARCSRVIKMDNIPLPLVHWRANDAGITRGAFDQSNKNTLEIQRKEIDRLGIIVSATELRFHREVGNGSGFHDIDEVQAASNWLDTLINYNNRSQQYLPHGLLQAAGHVWFKICLNSSGLGVEVLKQYYDSLYRRYYRPGKKELLQLIINGLFRFRKQIVGRVGEH